MIEIWNTTWTFFHSMGYKVEVKNVITKKIPLQFVINEKSSYDNALRDVMKTSSTANFISQLKINPITKLKDFKITYIKKIGIVNGSGMDQLY